MTPKTFRRAARLAANICSAIAAHNWGDQYKQTGSSAVNKGKPGHEGREACLNHVISYTLTHALAQPTVNRALGIRTRIEVWFVGHLATGLLHYVMDRSRDTGTLIDLMDRYAARFGVTSPKREYWDRGGQSDLDQAWHWACLMAWALLDAVASER